MISSSCFFKKTLMAPEEQLTIDSQSISPWIQTSLNKSHKRHSSMIASPKRNRTDPRMVKKNSIGSLGSSQVDIKLELPLIDRSSTRKSNRGRVQSCDYVLPPQKVVECYLQLVKNGRGYRSKYLVSRNIQSGNPTFFQKFMEFRQLGQTFKAVEDQEIKIPSFNQKGLRNKTRKVFEKFRTETEANIYTKLSLKGRQIHRIGQYCS